jgi:hypothetical protein
MRYLKKYKLFENNSDIKSYINDICLDLTDRGLFLSMDVNDSYINILLTPYDMDLPFIRPTTDSPKYFDLDDEMFNCFYTLESYLKSEEYRTSMITLSCNYSYGTKPEVSDWFFSPDQKEKDYADNVDDLKRIVDIFGYEKFTSIVFKFKHEPKLHNISESRFLDFRKTLETLKDFCLEFEDNECPVEIWPKDDIKLNLVSLRSRGLISFDNPFYLEIDINRRIIQYDDKRSGFGPLPNWFIDTCRTIESFMSEEGFETLPSVRYGIDWEKFYTVDELAEQEGLFYKVKLEFKPQ